jgi:signal transduction histidine kinase
MCPEADQDSLAYLIKENPTLETVIQNILVDYKRTTSMFIHELRNPLSLMKGTLQFIELKHPETKDFKYWGQLQELVHDMEIMMSDASQLNTCNNINKDIHNLLALLNTIMNNFMPQAAEKQIDLAMEIEDGCEAYYSSYSCDAIKLKQVFANLIKNAFEATSPGSFIHIYLKYLPGEEDILPKLSIRISNNGLPIPEEELESIFLPFVTYKKGGTGVGLAVVKKIIELHYGTISVASDESLTSFTILLPL